MTNEGKISASMSKPVDATKQPKYWMGSAPTQCDLVGAFPGSHDPMTEFVDGRTQMGPWANMCMKCHRRHGRGLGSGNGQHYKKQEDGRFLKIGG